MKNLALLLLGVTVVFLSARLVSIENQRYAAVLGLCQSQLVPSAQDPACLASVETRTSWAWHLFYAIKGQ